MKNKIACLTNHISLWVQLSFIMLLIVTATVFTLTYRNFTSIRDLTISNQFSLSSSLLRLESENLDHYIADLANFCIQPYYDSAFTRIINQKTPAAANQLDYAKQQMFYYYYTRNDIQEYELYLINQDISIGRTKSQEHITTQSAPNFDTGAASLLCSGSPMNQAIISCPDPDVFFTYYHSLFQAKGRVQQAIVRLQIDTSYLKQILKNHTENNNVLVILNEADQFIFSSDLSLFSAESDISEILNAQNILKSGARTVRIHGNNYLLIREASSKSGIQLINFIPLSYIDTALGSISSQMFVNGFLIWFTILLIIYLSVYLLTLPLKLLSARMQQAGSGDFHTFPEMKGSSEIAELSASFNSMLSHIEQLIQQNYIAEISEKNARLTALEAQLNPHFLYNTLQAISTEALINDQPKIHQMITNLASNLRYTIKAGDLVPLSAELQYLSDYVFLQQTRMGSALQFEIETTPGLENYLLPKISLQALVENSIIHGKSNGRETIEIKVSIKKLPDDRLRISVLDNGCGISPAQQEKLRNDFHIAMTAQNPGGIGLANLYVRLQLLYNAPTDLQIHSKEGEYTNIVLILPCVD